MVLSRWSLRRRDLEAQVVDDGRHPAPEDEEGAREYKPPSELDAKEEGKPVPDVDERPSCQSRATDDEGDDKDAASDQEREADENQERHAPNVTVNRTRMGSLVLFGTADQERRDRHVRALRKLNPSRAQVGPGPRRRQQQDLLLRARACPCNRRTSAHKAEQKRRTHYAWVDEHSVSRRW